MPFSFNADLFEMAPADWGLERPEMMLANHMVYMHGALRKRNGAFLVDGDTMGVLPEPFRPAALNAFVVVAHSASQVYLQHQRQQRDDMR